MLAFAEENHQLGNDTYRLWLDNDRKIIAFRNKDIVYLFNFHPTNSYESFHLPIHDTGDFKVVMDTDEPRFGGFDRISHGVTYHTEKLPGTDYDGIKIYIPSRTALALKKVK